MKKLKLAFSALLLMAMVISLSACGGSKLVGSWTASVDLTDKLTELISAQASGSMAGIDMSQLFDLSDAGIVIKHDMTFNSDGTYSSTTDNETTTNSLNSLKDAMVSGMSDFINDMADASGMDREAMMEAVEQGMGSTIEELVNESLETEELMSELNKKGKYVEKDGKLFLSDGEDADIDENEYSVYEISNDGKEFKILEEVSSDNSAETAELMKDMYPITYTKTQG